MSQPNILLTPELLASLRQLTEEWESLNGTVEDTKGEGGEHQQALADLESWNNLHAEELRHLEECEERKELALRRATGILSGQLYFPPDYR